MYHVLARQWRPQTFDDVVWQNHVTQALENALTAKRLHHAYLFTGTRGVGKTTLARIMAKCLLCEQGVTAHPCNQCDNCQNINHGQCIDLIEVDAASRTRVEDTRDLLENAHYAPTQARYKIYLIDEVHMLSTHSFNALLKTLEEPPVHVKFLFATTDPQKLPATMLSRCLQFHLKAIPEAQIVKRLKQILEKEKIDFEDEALTIVAHGAQGSMRDALSLLDQVIDHTEKRVSVDRTRELLGLADPVLILDILQAVVDQQPQTALICLQQLRDQSVDLSVVLDQLLGFLHTLALAKLCPSQLSHEYYAETLGALCEQMREEDIQLYYQIVLHGRRDLAYVPIIEHGVQMTLIRLFSFCPQTTAITTATAAAIPQPTAKTAPVTKVKQYHAKDWPSIVGQLQLSGVTQAIATHCACERWDGVQVDLLLDPSHAAFLSETQIKALQQALIDLTKQNIRLSIEIANASLDTPASLALAAREQAVKKVSQSMQSDENVQKLLNAFDAQIQPDSIEANRN